MTEVLGDEPVNKLEGRIASALRRRPAHEPWLSGTLRELAPFSPRLRQALEQAVAVLVQREAFHRPLYAAGTRALAEHTEDEAVPHLATALCSAEAGGLATLSAAAMVRAKELMAPLARATANRHPHLVFGAEVARVARGESDGKHSRAVAPKIKESHRISLCTELFVPLLQRPPLDKSIGPGLGVLRDSERHIGRWLLLSEVGARSGDLQPLEQACERARDGASSSRVAWALASWALGGSSVPQARPSLDVIARLSDRPTAERDLTFLFRMAEAKLHSAQPVLEGLVKQPPFNDELSIRAALALSLDYQRSDLAEPLVSAARCHRREGLRGLAAAALFDLGHAELAAQFADELVHSQKLPTLGWAALIRAAGAGKLQRLVTESRFRRVQRGWIE